MGRVPDAPTLVLVHAAGHSAEVWKDTQVALSSPSLAVDLPGRSGKPADITSVSVDEAAESVVADVGATVAGDVVLVGHSVAGTLIPSVAARLDGRVRHLVFVAGITAAEGQLPMEVFRPGGQAELALQLAELRRAYRSRTLETVDVRVASSIDSLNYCSQPMSWRGVPEDVPRTFVRCLRDPIQSRQVQERFIANCRAGQVIDIDTGHTPALEAPGELAQILDGIASASSARWRSAQPGPRTT
jgi:pimeloyl-ACP methyl ester carboxylesterase